MNKQRDENDRDEESNETDANDRSKAENEPGEDKYDRDESARGEGPDNLRRRSEWFQKRTGRR